MAAVDHSDEQQLIASALAGQRSAFAQLVHRHQDRLFASMLQVADSPEEAEEVVQDAFIRAFVKLDSFQQNSQFFTWLYRIAFNVALTRRRRKRARISLDQAREESGLEVVDGGDGVDEGMLQAERINLVRTAMKSLTVEHRTVLTLREMEDHSYEAIAEILEISIGTVRSRLNRARKQLKISLESIEQQQQQSTTEES